jgi:hypothetical protein
VGGQREDQKDMIIKAEDEAAARMYAEFDR